jgi:hypothetical protein
MGHMPYSRRSIAAVDLRGYPVEEKKKEGVAQWRESVF